MWRCERREGKARVSIAVNVNFKTLLKATKLPMNISSPWTFYCQDTKY